MLCWSLGLATGSILQGKIIRGLLQTRLKGQILVYLKIITFFELRAMCNVVCSGSFQGFKQLIVQSIRYNGRGILELRMIDCPKWPLSYPSWWTKLWENWGIYRMAAYYRQIYSLALELKRLPSKWGSLEKKTKHSVLKFAIYTLGIILYYHLAMNHPLPPPFPVLNPSI